MDALLWTMVGFLLGAIPFSVWLGRLALHADIRAYGDGNPGGTNVIRAGSRALGLLVIALDMLKGALPVSLAHYLFHVDGWPLVPVLLAPILGHAFSPFLRWRGGKALAATFGAWTALTVPIGPFVMGGSVFVFHKLLKVSAWAVLAALLMLLGFLLVTGAKLPWLVAWAGTVLILLWTHRAEWRTPGQEQPR
jgi:glycerol-3-phosphate acyltransferase PlsY